MTRISLRSFPVLALSLAAAVSSAQQTGNIAINNVGRDPHPSAILDVNSLYTPIASAQQKGMLIPRMTLAERGTLGLADQGLMIYQEDNTPGFYYLEGGVWTRIDGGANTWRITGNNTSSSFNDFLGTRGNNADFNMSSNGLPFELTLKGSAGVDRYLGVGTTTPVEMVDVNGAIRIFKPAAPYSQTTTTPGVIFFQPPGVTAADTLFSNFIPPASPVQSRDAIMWNGHWGQTGATTWNLGTVASDVAQTGTWRRLENPYEERFTKTYTQQGSPTCAPGSVDIPSAAAGGNWTVFPAANMAPTSGLTVAQQALASPYPYWTGATVIIRARHQHMILASELDVEKNQLGINPLGLPAVGSATNGLCKGQPVTSIGWYVGNIGTLSNGQRSVTLTNFAITIKHVPFGLNNLAAGFDNSIDAAQACYQQAGATFRPTLQNGWETFTPLSQPFVWDGIRNVVIEITLAGGANAPSVQPPVLIQQAPGGLQLTASWNVPSIATGGVACYPNGLAGSCTATVSGGNMPWNNIGVPGVNPCGTNGTHGGTSAWRPVFRFGGTVATAGSATSGNNSFLWYRGGMVVEATTPPTNPGWGRRVTPGYTFRGPGTLCVERGVFDNGVRLNDHVFDRAFDGRVNPADATDFGASRNVSIDEMARFTENNRHLPTMRGRESWNREGGFSLGDLTNQLWTTTETQALYVTELHDRLDLLEVLSTDRPISPDELSGALEGVSAMKDLSDAEKNTLMNSLRARSLNTNQR